MLRNALTWLSPLVIFSSLHYFHFETRIARLYFFCLSCLLCRATSQETNWDIRSAELEIYFTMNRSHKREIKISCLFSPRETTNLLSSIHGGKIPDKRRGKFERFKAPKRFPKELVYITYSLKNGLKSAWYELGLKFAMDWSV